MCHRIGSALGDQDVEPTLEKPIATPQRMVMQFDSDRLGVRIAAGGSDATNPYPWPAELCYHDERKLGHYTKKRRVVERLLAWLGIFRLILRHE